MQEDRLEIALRVINNLTKMTEEEKLKNLKGSLAVIKDCINGHIKYDNAD